MVDKSGLYALYGRLNHPSIILMGLGVLPPEGKGGDSASEVNNASGFWVDPYFEIGYGL